MMSSTTDQPLLNVCDEIKRADPNGKLTAGVLRDTLDQLYDGQRTGRYNWDQLYKTEKTHCGTLVEINLQRAFAFKDGTVLDYKIAGVDVDCKYSQDEFGWMIPPEAHGELCLLLWTNDQKSIWSMGIVRAHQNLLGAENRDGKAKLNQDGRNAIHWIFRNEGLPPNVLLHLPDTVVKLIMGHKSGQKRVNELFRQAPGLRIGRGVVATVAQQDDYMKRVRGNGGARSALKSEGIVILGQYESHKRIAVELGVPVPEKGESVALRLTPTQAGSANTIELDGKYWKIAQKGDPIVPAPKLPKPTKIIAGFGSNKPVA